MNIMQIIGEPTGGIRRHVHSIIYDLMDKNIACSYVYSVKGQDAVFIEDMDHFIKRGITSLQLVLHKAPHLNDLDNVLKIYSLCKKQKIDIIHAHSAKAGVYARIVGMLLHIKVIYTPHGGVLHDAYSTMAKWVYLSVEKLLMLVTDLLIFESEYSKKAYFLKVGIPKCKFIVNYNGVSPCKIKITHSVPPMILNRQYYHAGIFARLHELKGQELAIEAIARLNRSHILGKEIILHLFGSGENEHKLRELAGTLPGAQGFVFFYGDIDNPEEVMKELNTVLIPSFFESFSYVAAEAMLAGVPVIAARVGGLQEVLADNAGLLFDKHDPAELASAVEYLFSKQFNAAALIERARKRCQLQFNQDVMLNNIFFEYNCLASQQQ